MFPCEFLRHPTGKAPSGVATRTFGMSLVRSTWADPLSVMESGSRISEAPGQKVAGEFDPWYRAGVRGYRLQEVGLPRIVRPSST